MKINILFVIPSLEISGAEKVCCQICDNLDYDKFNVSLISLSNNVPLLDTLKNKDKINFYSCNEPEKLGFPWFSFKSFIKFNKIIRKIKPNIVHSHLWGIHCIYLLAFLFLKNKPKFLATIHSSGYIYTSNKISSRSFKFIENTIYKIFKFNLIAISNAVEDTIKKNLYYNTLTKIENGIDVSLFSPDKRIKYSIFKNNNYNNNFPILIHVGKAAENKRQIDIIKAISLIKNDFPNLKLLLVGRNNKEAFAEITNELGIEDNVDFIEPTNEVIKYLSIADIGIFPSIYEGLSLALAEMMSCGLPLVISDIPSFTEMTNHGEAALIVPIKNPVEIANKIRYLLENPGVAQSIKKRARELAMKKYSIDNMIKKHIDLYESIYNCKCK